MKDKIDVPAELAIAIYGTTNLTDIDDDNCDGVEDLDDPFTKFFEKAQFEKAIGQSSSGLTHAGWNEPISDAVVKKSDEHPSGIGTLAKNLGIVRSEVVDIGGTRWSRGYDAQGQLISARVIF